MSSFNREVVLHSVELIGKLATNPENTSMFDNCPDTLFLKLTELLTVTTLGVEPFELAIKNRAAMATNFGASALTDVIGISGVDDLSVPACTAPFIEFSDAEVRDTALDAVYSLCQASQKNVQRFANTRSCNFCLQIFILIDSL